MAINAPQKEADTLKTILYNLTEGVAVVDLDGKFLFANPKAKRIMDAGGNGVDLAGWRVVHDHDSPGPGAERQLDQVLLARARRGEEIVNENIYISKGAGPHGVWINTNSKPLRNGDGSVWGAMMIFDDITERRLAEQRLFLTSSRFAALIENQQAAILIENEERRVLLANQTFCDLFAIPMSPAELHNTDCSQLAERAKTLFVDPEGFTNRIAQLLRDKSVVVNEKLPLVDGRVLERDYIPTHIEEHCHGHIWQYRDITEHQKSQGQIKVYQRLCMALEQTADNVVITDRQGRIEYVNPAFETTTGYRKDEVLGKSPRILKSGRHDSDFYHQLWSQVLAGRSFEDTIINKKKTGELYWSRQTITPMKDDQGNITHFVSVLKDITELLKQQKHDAEMRLAREVQQRFYGTAKTIPGFDIAGTVQPTHETGGDYFDLFPMQDGCFGIAIGDVSRHGISSALVMAETRAYLRSFATIYSDVGDILTQVNRALVPDLDQGRFVTLLLVRLNPDQRSIVYANAGHIPGFLLDKTGKVNSVLESTDPPLGILADRKFHSSEALQLVSGQTMMLMTDGITESLALEDAELGITRAIEYVREHLGESARQIADGLYRSAHGGPASEHELDDATTVILKIN